MGDQYNSINNEFLNLIASLVKNGVSKKKKKSTLKHIRYLAMEAKDQVRPEDAKQAIAQIINATTLPKTGKAITQIQANIYDAIRFNVSPLTTTY